MDAGLKLQRINAFLVGTANLAGMEEAAKTYDALSMLTGFVRYAFCKDDATLLSRELAILGDYLRLMALSCPLPLCFEIGEEPRVCEKCIPMLCLIESVDMEIEKALQAARRNIRLRITVGLDAGITMEVCLDGGATRQIQILLPDAALVGGHV